MTIRTTLLTIAGAGVLATALAPAARAADADGWRFVRAYRSITSCQGAGQGLVDRHEAREFRCEDTSSKADAPVLDLYTR